MTTTLTLDLTVGDIVFFHSLSFEWLYPHYGPGEDNAGLRGLVIEADEDHLIVLLLQWKEGLSEWDNMVFYGVDVYATDDHAVDLSVAGIDIVGKHVRRWEADDTLSDLIRGLATMTEEGWSFDDAWDEMAEWWFDVGGEKNLQAAGVVIQAAYGSPSIKEVVRSLADEYEPTPQDHHTLWFGCATCDCDKNTLPRAIYDGLSAPVLGSECTLCYWPEMRPYWSESSGVIWGFLDGPDSDGFHEALATLFDNVVKEVANQNHLTMEDIDAMGGPQIFDLGGWAGMLDDSYFSGLDGLYRLTKEACRWVQDGLDEELARKEDVDPTQALRTEVENLRKATAHAQSVLASMEGLVTS